MLNKKLNLVVDSSTFPRSLLSPVLRGLPRVIDVDADAALLMLGTVTIPGGYSVASPAQQWASVRYLSAISTDPDLRIIGPFVDLDPHQKGILSDDFGVAFCTKWLYDVLSGFVNIVDGRRFLLLYGTLVHQPPKKKLPKVGPGKCPDFIALDHSGKWHVLECKGTQTSRAYRDKQLEGATLQKKVIRVTGSVRGEQLAAGLFIGTDRGSERSQIRVVDPAGDPFIVLDAAHTEKAENAVRRLATARACGLAGIYHLSEELSLPSERDEHLTTLYHPSELRRFERSGEERLISAVRAAGVTKRIIFSEGAREYEGRETHLELPGDISNMANTASRRIRIRYGIDAKFLEQVRSSKPDAPEDIDALSRPLLDSNKGITFVSDQYRTTLRDGDLFVATIDYD